MTETFTETFTITIDGREIVTATGTMLLDAIRDMGIDVPTLCQHDALEPTGACRLCVVEITHADWKGWSGLVTSCLYPVEPGLIVSTHSDRVVATRRTLLEMLLARCPDTDAVRRMARAEGIEMSGFTTIEGADKCVMCGLCVRVCQDLGPAAIAALGRGSEKEVGPRPDKVGEDCAGCGACALVCPTGEIVLDRGRNVARIWNREFELPPFEVVADICRGCGVCEEVCPLSIPRVKAFRTGALVAAIAPDVCVSCGLCAGACPTGAIRRTSPETSLPEESIEDRVVAFACPRSVLPGDLISVTVPCVGRVTTEDILECLARGARGVLVVGRSKETCEFGPGEDMAAERVRVCEELAALAGLGAGRVRFVVPPAGFDGPARACAGVENEFAATPLTEAFPIADTGDPIADIGDASLGMDRARQIMQWLLDRDELAPSLPPDLTELFGSSAADGVVYVGDLPVVDRLLSLIVTDGGVRSLLEDAAALLKLKGIDARVLMTAREVAKSGARRVYAYCADGCAPDFGDTVELVTFDSLPGVAREAPAACAEFRFQIKPAERAELIRAMEAQNATCVCPAQVAQLSIFGREGAWQQGLRPRPVMAFQEALSGAKNATKSAANVEGRS